MDYDFLGLFIEVSASSGAPLPFVLFTFGITARCSLNWTAVGSLKRWISLQNEAAAGLNCPVIMRFSASEYFTDGRIHKQFDFYLEYVQWNISWICSKPNWSWWTASYSIFITLSWKISVVWGKVKQYKGYWKTKRTVTVRRAEARGPLCLSQSVSNRNSVKMVCKNKLCSRPRRKYFPIPFFFFLVLSCLTYFHFSSWYWIFLDFRNFP